MNLNPSEISELIKSRIEGLGASTEVRNQGTVVSVDRRHRPASTGCPTRCRARCWSFSPDSQGNPDVRPSR